jgi:signal transduction histidine kinase
MGRTVDALVAAARADASSGRRSADVVAAAREVIASVDALAGDCGVAVALQPSSESITVGVDADLLERMISPILENACRYASSEIRVGIDRAGGRVVLRVRDDGPGVADGEHERIFEPGVRGAAGNGRDGAGLGLALSRRLARAAGGDVRVEHTTGGASFVVDLPAA